MPYEYESSNKKWDVIIRLETHPYRERIAEYVKENYDGKTIRDLKDSDLFIVACTYLDD